MTTPAISAQDMAQLRSWASRGDKMAGIMIRTFDAVRSSDSELHLARAATTAQRTLSGLANTVLDGITPVADDLVLVKSQDDAKENGLYLAAAGTWHRLKDAQGSDVIRPGMLVQIREGTTLQDTLWEINANSTSVGTDNITFTQMLAAAAASGAFAPSSVNNAAYFAYQEDFLLNAGGTLPPPLAKDLNNTTSGDYLANTAAGVYSLATAAVSEAQDAQLTFGNQLVIDPTKGPVFEARVRVNIPGATISADERWVVGMCSAHTNSEDALDAVVTNVWFKAEGANLNITIEGDDGTHDVDDTDSTVDYADNVYQTFKIDMSSLAAVKMYIDGVQVATTLNLSALTNANLLQPIFCYQRDAGTEINLLQIDWFKVTATR